MNRRRDDAMVTRSPRRVSYSRGGTPGSPTHRDMRRSLRTLPLRRAQSGGCHNDLTTAFADSKARCRAQVKRTISSSWYAGFQGSHSAACHCRSYTVPRAVDSVCGNLCLSGSPDAGLEVCKLWGSWSERWGTVSLPLSL